MKINSLTQESHQSVTERSQRPAQKCPHTTVGFRSHIFLHGSFVNGVSGSPRPADPEMRCLPTQTDVSLFCINT